MEICKGKRGRRNISRQVLLKNSKVICWWPPVILLCSLDYLVKDNANIPVPYSGRLGDRYTSLDAQIVLPKKYFKFSFFQLYFNKNRLKQQSMISQCINGLGDKNSDRREEQWDNKSLKRRKKLSTKVFLFISIRNRSRKYLLFLLR